MRKASDRLWSLIEPAVEGLGYELAGIEYLPQGRHSVLRIYIDHENGILVEDCVSVSHQVSGLLDVEDPIKGNYSLEVSSPGTDRPLFTLEQFAKFAGEQVQLKLNSPINERRKLIGTIKQVDGDTVVIDMDDQEYRLILDDIDSARLVPVFD
ncbi:MAG: ribosome maturation factor RimP [Gammaproteobacteria bacterium]|nr:ribosome maturation factor RimP [Gammaproteobacteria bacterium]